MPKYSRKNSSIRINTKPSSDVPGYVGWFGALGLLLGVWLVHDYQVRENISVALLLICAAVPMVAAELWRMKVVDTWFVLARRVPSSISLLGSLLPWLCTLSLFHAFSPNSIGGFVGVLVTPLGGLVIVLWLLKNYYVEESVHVDWQAWLDKKLHPMEMPWGRFREGLVKAFFIPLMVSFLVGWAVEIPGKNFALHWFFFPIAILYLIDTVFATLGYLVTSRSIGSHVQSTNPYSSAWIAALVCYPPFWGVLSGMVGIQYRNGLEWMDIVSAPPWVVVLWGGSIITFTGIYAWATIAFGLRFSNLTYRGVITDGPYRYSRHPAYLSKNLVWWMTVLPFFPVSNFRVTLFYSLCLLIVNSIYWARAITEENHLLSIAKYRVYWRYMQRRGILWRCADMNMYKTRIMRFVRKYPLVVPIILIVGALLVKPNEDAFLEERVGVALRQMGISGSSWLLSINPDGQVERRVVGLQDEIFTLDRPFPVASLTKPVTAFLISELVAEGALDGQSLVDELVEAWPEGASLQVSLESFLMHRSGLRDGNEIFDEFGNIRGCESAVNSLSGLDAPLDRGEHYANLNYCVLGKILEKVTAKSYEALVGELVDQYALNDGYAVDKSTTLFCRDYASLHAAGGLCLYPEQALKLLSEIIKKQVVPDRPTDADKKAWYYGYGWRVWDEGEELIFSHYGLVDNWFSLAFFKPDGSGYLVLIAERPKDYRVLADGLVRALR